MLVAIAYAGIRYHLSYVPADLDLSATRPSDHGAYRVDAATRTAGVEFEPD